MCPILRSDGFKYRLYELPFFKFTINVYYASWVKPLPKNVLTWRRESKTLLTALEA